MLTFCESDPTTETDSKPCLYPSFVSAGTFNTQEDIKLRPVEYKSEELKGGGSTQILHFSEGSDATVFT